MSQFLENARRLFEAAESAARVGQMPSDLTILIAPEGGIHMVADSDWPLDRMLADRGARMAYRIGEGRGKVQLEGCTFTERCCLERVQHAREILWGPRLALPTGAS